MKTLILYATKYGAAREIAEKIAKNIDGAEIYDLKQNNIPSFDNFDCVIIGSSLYAGSIRKEAKIFLSQNAGAFQGKNIGLFLSGMAESGEEKFFESNFPAEIVRSAKAADILGGVFDPEKAGFMERFIMKIITKQPGYINKISDDKIARFAEIMKT